MAKRKTAYQDRQLESFSRAVLAEFIRENVPMLSAARTNKVFADLIHIEARQRLERINKELDRLLAKSKSLHGVEHIKEYLAVQTQIDALWREQEEALNIAFPQRKNPPEETNGTNKD